jgi:hypothetical protein
VARHAAGLAELPASVGIPSFSFYAQAFFGYNETLLHYNERNSVFRFGIAFDDRFSFTTGEPGSVTRAPLLRRRRRLLVERSKVSDTFMSCRLDIEGV